MLTVGEFLALPFFAVGGFLFLAIPFGKVEINGEVLRGFVPNFKARVEMLLMGNTLIAMGQYLWG